MRRQHRSLRQLTAWAVASALAGVVAIAWMSAAPAVTQTAAAQTTAAPSAAAQTTAAKATAAKATAEQTPAEQTPAVAAAPAPKAFSLPSDAAIRDILKERIDTQQQSIGIVVGVIDAAGRRVIAHGARAKGDAAPLNGDTVYELGSITKVFTSLILADMVQRGEVKLTDPVQQYLPDSVKVPQRNGKSITLEDLATHTSGLPRMPGNFAPKNPANPYADYTVDQLFAFVSGYTLTRDIGERYEYSNLGAGLLGQALARRAGMDYEALVRARITGPLGMASTVVTLSPDLQARASKGHDNMMQPASYWDLPALAGAGALRSTANDMLAFLAAPLGYKATPLAPAFAAMTMVRRPMPMEGMSIALGWHVITRDGHPLYWHNGGTGGFRTFMAYLPEPRVGIVVLANASTAAGVDDIGLYLLGARPALAKPAPPPQLRTLLQTPIDPKRLDGYVGRYELKPDFILSITRDGTRLFAQATGQRQFELFPETERTFFAKVVDILVEFDAAPGPSPQLTLHQGGNALTAKRVQGDATAKP